MGEVALGREIEIFVKEETVAGTLVEPDTTDADVVLAINTPTIVQERETFDDAQKRNTRSRLTAIAGRYLSGTWSFDSYIRPSGTAGNVPMEDNLVYGLLGTRTVNSGTNVSYTLVGAGTDLPSFSMWFKDGHTVYMCYGSTVNQGVFKVDGRTPGQISWSGGFMKRLWTGRSTLGAAITDTSGTSITVVQGDLFNIGSIIQIGTEVLKVTNVATNTLTVTRGYKSSVAATHLNGVAVSAWWPTANESGFGGPIHGRLGYVKLDGSDYNTLTNEVTMTNGIKYYEEEKNNQDWCTVFGTPEMRSLEARVTCYFRYADAKRFKDAYDWDSMALIVPCGTAAGATCTITLPQNRLKAPATSGDAERIQELTFLPFSSSSYNDEISITYS
jgi:hypothetical protein